MEYSTIYQKIKQLRLNRKITIQDLSVKTGLTPGYLSKIENSEKPPPIPTLVKIAYALNVHISYFFEEDSETENGPSLIRKNDRKEIIGDYTYLGYRYHAVTKKSANGAFKPLIITLPDNMEPENIPYNYHDGEEMIYVLQGKMNFYYGDEQYLIEEGDCLHFNSTIPHKVVGVDENYKVKILSVLSL
ncbi:MAG: helix-turn-helix domain-containing protein [Deltaproteobacteria bacterium]|jgi:transcriptional regulator with XRE-family HTH domain|nr:helix-turn-helix domain-containing protein [Deltaproteobacteria bacterium]